MKLGAASGIACGALCALALVVVGGGRGAALDVGACVETAIAAPPEDARAFPLDGATPAGDELWFEMTCGEDAPWFSGALFVRNVTRASLTPFSPDPSKATGAAAIIAPGGGTVLLSMDREGYGVARWLADQGVAAYVLKYRTIATPEDPDAFHALLDAITPPFPPEPVITSEQGAAEERATLADGMAAVRHLRENAVDLGIDEDRIAMIGFSAGAYTTLNVAIKADAPSRPNLIGVLYGALPALPSSPLPPAFIAAAADDPQVPAAESLRIFRTWTEAGAPAELHVFESGGHGFGVEEQGAASDAWMGLFAQWLGEHEFLAE